MREPFELRHYALLAVSLPVAAVVGVGSACGLFYVTVGIVAPAITRCLLALV